jgi:hypothetical protein
VVSWGELRRSEPELADAGHRMLYQYGDVGLGFLATVTRAGGPRVHPVCPMLTDDGLYVLVIPSFKRDDLRRGSGYALHSFPAEDNEDAFYATGTASWVERRDVRLTLEAQFLAERGLAALPPGSPEHQPFELDISRILLTWTDGHGDPKPRHTIWRAPRAT